MSDSNGILIPPSAYPDFGGGLDETEVNNLITSQVSGLSNQITTISNELDDKADKTDIPAAIEIDTALSTTSTNPVQNKVIKTALDGKANTSDIPQVDSALSTTSTNPVQNKVVKAALDTKQDKMIAGENITIAEDGKTISATGGSGGGDNNGCCFTPVANADDSLAFTVDHTKTLYTANITTDAFETTLSVSDTNSVIADGEVCVIWLHIKVANSITTAPQIIIPNEVQFLDNGPSFAVGSECMLALMSTDGGATWQANVQWEREVSA